jgi:guanylate kinase
MKQGLLIVISAPSGTGKSTLIRELRTALPDLEYSVSVTTRPARRDEKDGIDYVFAPQAEFERAIKNDEFLEHAMVFDHYYGTKTSAVESAIRDGKDILLDVDIQGAIQIKHKCDGIFIFVIPPSLKILEDRLRKRNTDVEQEIVKRIARAKEEISNYVNYDYVIYNDYLADSIYKLKSIIAAEKCRVFRNKSILKEFGI